MDLQLRQYWTLYNALTPEPTFTTYAVGAPAAEHFMASSQKGMSPQQTRAEDDNCLYKEICGGLCF